MKNILIAFALLAAGLCSGETEFFVFDNGVGRGSWTPGRQARVVKENKFDGISYNFTSAQDLAAWQKACAEQKLKICALYVFAYLDGTNTLQAGFREAVPLLKGTDTVIWLAVRESNVPGNHDDKAAKIVQEVADLAASVGVQVSLYGHAKFYIENGVDAARLARKVNRPNVGASINLCHEFLSGKGADLDRTLKEVAPLSNMASVNGVDVANSKYIVRLDKGDFDVAAYISKLQKAGYKGPIGLQCYSVEGDTDENLNAAGKALESIRARLKTD